MNGHIAIPTHIQRPGSPTSSQIPTKKHVSSISAPTTPLHTPVQSPVPPPTASHVDMSPSKLPHSPSKSPRARRRTYEPVIGMFDNTFIKKFLPRKKPSKQISLPDKLSVSYVYPKMYLCTLSAKQQSLCTYIGYELHYTKSVTIRWYRLSASSVAALTSPWYVLQSSCILRWAFFTRNAPN